MIPRSLALVLPWTILLVYMPPATNALISAHAMLSAQRLQGSAPPAVSAMSSDSMMQPSSRRRKQAQYDVNWDWKAVAKEAFEDDDRPIVMFDGACNLCNGGVNFAIDHDPRGYFRFVSLQSKIGQSLLLKNGKSPTDISSIVLCYPEKSYFKTDAVLRISQQFDATHMKVFGHVGLAVPAPIRECVYRLISENRYEFSKLLPEEIQENYYNQCRLDIDGEYESRFLEDP